MGARARSRTEGRPVAATRDNPRASGGRTARAPERSGSQGRRARERSRPPAKRLELPRIGIWFIAAWAALLVLAPAAHNGFWGVNGFRSLTGEARLGLILAAAAAPALLRLRSRGLAVAIAVTLGIVIAFPLRERVHFLGDTQVRLRAMAIFNASMISVTLAEWATRLHANPLDIVIDFLLPIGLRRLGASLYQSVSLVSAALAVAFFAGVWRVTGRLGLPSEARIASCAAIACAGTLQAFAGYAESAGLLLASAVWWWAEMMAPLDRPRQAFKTAGAWLAMVLSHRLGLVMLLPLVWRALGPPLAGDRPETRRRLLLLGGTAALLAGAGTMAGGGGRQLGMDLRDMMAALTGIAQAVPPSDYLNTVALVAPLAFLAPWLAGRDAIAGFVRSPLAGPLIAGSLALLPLMWMIPANSHGLGAHRDWDLAALGGLTLTLTAIAMLGRLPSGRLRGALACALPLLVLQVGGWLLVNASERVTMTRAKALVEKPPGLAESHLSHLHGYLGQRAMDMGAPAFAAPELERSFELNRNPRRALLAAEAWARAGDLPRARSALARGRAAGPLSPSVGESARRLDVLITQLAADSARRALPAPPGGQR